MQSIALVHLFNSTTCMINLARSLTIILISPQRVTDTYKKKNISVLTLLTFHHGRALKKE